MSDREWLAALYTAGASAVHAELEREGVLATSCPTDPDAVRAALVPCLSRYPLEPDWAARAARAVVGALASRRWCAPEDEPRARALTRRALLRLPQPSPA